MTGELAKRKEILAGGTTKVVQARAIKRVYKKFERGKGDSNRT